jgi:hypothetical protein
MTSGLTPHYKVLGHLQEGDYFGGHCRKSAVAENSSPGGGAQSHS